MQYDIRLHLSYEYHRSAAGSRHHVRVLPVTGRAAQRLVASSLNFDPAPDERGVFTDFFGNSVATLSYRSPHDTLDIRMSARVAVDRDQEMLDVSPDMARLRRELCTVSTLDPSSPLHFLAPSPRVALDPEIVSYARESVTQKATVVEIADGLMRRIDRDFTYDADATKVGTLAREAFALRRGVCQDFSHVMIAGLRGLGIPAGYVSGFLRTIPPPGKERLEGADAMHAWVRVWCGVEAGWLEFDPTNAMRAGNDHIVVGYGRDYGDVAPIVGVLKTSGEHEADQAVDVIPVETY
jgi:transglutaminase-like putative cysteine protease